MTDEDPCDETKLEQEFALVTAAMPENLGLMLVAVSHPHGMHVMIENNLPVEALVDLLNSVLIRANNDPPATSPIGLT